MAVLLPTLLKALAALLRATAAVLESAAHGNVPPSGEMSVAMASVTLAQAEMQASGSSAGPESPGVPGDAGHAPVASDPATAANEPEPMVWATERNLVVAAPLARYHKSKGCSGLASAGPVKEVTLTKAKNHGLTPCLKCMGQP